MFSNPVSGTIKPEGSPSISGEFRVTSSFAEHIASGRGPGVDIGDGRCGDPVLSMGAGTISYIRWGVVGSTTADLASIIRVRHNTTYETGYAHLKIKAGLMVGQVIPVGYQLGIIDTIGATACHLHVGCKQNGVEVDVWPLLDQNSQEELMPFKSAGPTIGSFSMPAGGHALISPSDTKVRYPQPAGGTFNVYASLDLASDIEGNTPPKNNRNQVYVIDAPNFGAAAYALRADGTFTPTPKGFSQAELDAAKKKAASDAASSIAAAAVTASKMYP